MRMNEDNSAAPYLIVGLGNPAPEYRMNRHNVGFMVLDELAAQLNEKFSRVKFESLLAEGRFEEQKIVLAKPRTFMNMSGRAVSALMRFHKLPPEHLMVIYDDVDLPFDSLRLRAEGGTAGHKGMRSITESIATKEFPRLRVGIGKAAGKMSTPSHVLQDFSKKEQEFLPIIVKEAADAVLTFISEGIDSAMNKHNRNQE